MDKKELNYEEIGKKIKEIRKKKKWTRYDLAEKIKKSPSSVRKYERGDIKIPKGTLRDLSEVLGVDLLNGGLHIFQELEGYKHLERTIREQRKELAATKKLLMETQKELIKLQRRFIYELSKAREVTR